MILKEDDIRLIVRKVLKEAAMDEFNFEKLGSIKSFVDRIKYCNKMLGDIQGRGSSRICYQIDDNKILKLAMNQKGIAQNMEEGQTDYYKEQLGIFPKIFDESDKRRGLWLVSEYVLPVNRKDFWHCFGFGFDTFVEYIQILSSLYSRERKYDNETVSKVEELFSDNEALSPFYDYIVNYQLSEPQIRDMAYLGNYGLTIRNGKPTIVLLDSGLNEDIYNMYYKVRRF